MFWRFFLLVCNLCLFFPPNFMLAVMCAAIGSIQINLTKIKEIVSNRLKFRIYRHDFHICLKITRQILFEIPWKWCFDQIFFCVTCTIKTCRSRWILSKQQCFLKNAGLFPPCFDDFFSLFRFYVGCDVCSNWFHGSCVGINETMAKNMTEYICDECRNARENREIYCICQQPYDETQ